MLFNSFEFLIFFPIVTLLYYALPYGLRVYLLVAASCFFYMYFIPVYLLILVLLILIDYFAGILIEQNRNRRGLWLAVSLVANISLLAVFKYFNFINTNLEWLATHLGLGYAVPAFPWMLPLGLSFHTFQAMSYTIEVYRGTQKAERSLPHYSLYVLFYPQLVAGPIERPQNLLQQFRQRHTFDYQQATAGLALMAWGLFKKVVIADRLSLFVEPVFKDPGSYDGVAFTVAAIFFAFQIYCDFSGYSDIAIGAARVMGIQLMTNFRRPYLAQSLGDFWRRWHISLSTWFKDYLYIPLGGSKVPVERQCFNLLIVFMISGLWHGASWTFVIWGLIHGSYRAGELALEKNHVRPLGRLGLERWPALCGMVRSVWLFTLVTVAWIFFRAQSVGDAFYMLSHLGKGWGSLFRPNILPKLFAIAPPAQLLLSTALIVFLLLVERVQEAGPLGVRIAQQPWPVRWAVYYGLAFGLLVLGVFTNSQFIYFQF